MHAPYILSDDNLGDFSGFRGKASILEADDFLGACGGKTMTPKKLWTLVFPQLYENAMVYHWTDNITLHHVIFRINYLGLRKHRGNLAWIFALEIQIIESMFCACAARSS